jgi:hypothetical protein
MSWLFSQALVEEYWGDTSLDGEQSVPLSGNNTQQAYCAPDKMTKFSRLSRFGMTYKPLTDARGEELCKSYREVFLAKIFQLQETGQALTESAQACGEKWHGLLAKFDQDSHLWRTVQCSLLEDLNESLQTLPAWGMTVGGELYLRPTLVRHIKEKESGYWLTPNLMWPTPSTRDHKGGYIGGRIRNGKVSWDTLDVAVQHTDNQSKDGGQLNPTWVEWLMGWPLGFTDLKPLEMGRFPCVRLPHGESLEGNCNGNNRN